MFIFSCVPISHLLACCLLVLLLFASLSFVRLIAYSFPEFVFFACACAICCMFACHWLLRLFLVFRLFGIRFLVAFYRLSVCLVVVCLLAGFPFAGLLVRDLGVNLWFVCLFAFLVLCASLSLMPSFVRYMFVCLFFTRLFVCHMSVCLFVICLLFPYVLVC